MHARKKIQYPYFSYLVILSVLMLTGINSYATRVSGKVFNSQSIPLPFASVLIKGTTIGTTSNSNGEYFLDLTPGDYTIICQYVGYEKREKQLTVGNEPVIFNFVLKAVTLSLQEIVIKPGGEDPAYEIIRNAIKKRPDYLKQVSAYQCDVYIKGQIKLNEFPKKFMGQRIELEDGDSGRNRIVFLSETIAKYSFTQPNKQKVEVISTRVSGQSNGLGFSNPEMISFYENNVMLPRLLNPRGFISPIADNALYYYRYKYLGAFIEDGVQVSRIQVIPKRKFEPVFSGYIQIVENEWRIHSLQLTLTKEAQVEIVNQLVIDQIYMPVAKDIWMLQTQNVYPQIKMFGFDGGGYFTTLYSNYTIEPVYRKKFFDRIVLRYDTASNKRSQAYWDSVRPVPLLDEEVVDFRRKDSLEKQRQDPKYLDSLDRRQNKLTFSGLVLNGQTFQRRSKNRSFEYDPVLKSVSFNTVEGLSVQTSGTFTKDWTGRKSLSITPVLRYGFSNKHFNAFFISSYRFGNKLRNSVSFSGGKRIYQFNNDNPIPQVINTFSTLFDGNNFMKIYEARFASIGYSKAFGEGFQFDANVHYQNRYPLENTDTTTFWGKSENKTKYTPNYPTELTSQNLTHHQAFITAFTITYRPGTNYIELPDRTISIGSKYPVLRLGYTRGFRNIIGSDIEFDKWFFSIQDNINMKTVGELRYHGVTGGFLSKSQVAIPDYQHYEANLSIKANPYLNSFQLLSYYLKSNTADFYFRMHLEHRYNGFLTNKIPGIRRYNLHLVTGGNMLYINKNNYYFEVFAGIDNIFKIFRIDYVWGFSENGFYGSDIRIGIKAFNSIFEDY
ncbi:DUF5686 and carboxypeptidase regulatory-like domain-containing protein [Pollutibacter soli]|uniref:DUF5686 and carboxypeptidase regulatory-like domain-containing protein n=1 Tax=Pollutibacter soli TaxID=3034157 RepID=UPI003013B9AB